MTMHLLRKLSASNRDTYGRYEIHKLRGTFLIVSMAIERKHIPVFKIKTYIKAEDTFEFHPISNDLWK